MYWKRQYAMEWHRQLKSGFSFDLKPHTTRDYNTASPRSQFSAYTCHRIGRTERGFLMKYRKLRNVDVSEIGFGAWAIGGSWGVQDEKDSLAALHRALDLGIT